MTKLNFSDALDMIQDGHHVRTSDILVSALDRKVWVAEWHLPGCLSESFSICTRKVDAIECALNMADSPRGMHTALEKYGRFDSQSEMFGTCINTIERRTLRELCA